MDWAILQGYAFGFVDRSIYDGIGFFYEANVADFFYLWLYEEFVFLLVHILFVITGRRRNRAACSNRMQRGECES